jgi:hypothetical protein
MNNTIFYDIDVSDEVRRQRLYEGQLFAYSTRASVKRLVDFARSMIEDAFGGLDPRTAQNSMDVERYAELLAKLKPAFIHHPESKRHLRGILEDFGCDVDKTYFDVPRMRSSTSDNYLTTGIAYAWHPHRDTWYSAPACQVNWWLPIYDIESENAMAFHPSYWSRPSATGQQTTTITRGTNFIAARTSQNSSTAIHGHCRARQSQWSLIHRSELSAPLVV